MKVVVTGKSGILGSAFCRLLEDDGGFEVFSFDSNELDITDFDFVERRMLDIRPDVVLNCAAYTNVDLAESEPERAYLINGEAVRNLGRLSESLGFRLVHFSTDYVFDGANAQGYSEEAPQAPINVYGKSKEAGELAICGLSSAYVVRTSWLFGLGGKNFVDTMLNLALSGEPVRVVNDQFGSPTFAPDLARAVLNDFLLDSPTSGIYHLTNEGVFSWYQFAGEIFKAANLTVDLVPISSDQFLRPAPRPKHSVLLNSKLPKLRDCCEALREYVILRS